MLVTALEEEEQVFSPFAGGTAMSTRWSRENTDISGQNLDRTPDNEHILHLKGPAAGISLNWHRFTHQGLALTVKGKLHRLSFLQQFRIAGLAGQNGHSGHALRRRSGV